MVKKIIVLVGVVIAMALAWHYGSDYLTLENIKESQQQFHEYYESNTILVLLVFFCTYVGVTALSLPGAAVMTLLAGALFGLLVGTIMVSFASSIGATLAFLVARFLLGEHIQSKYGDKLSKINKGIEEEGAFYLFTMRLIPAFPFFLINILMGCTQMRAVVFYLVSQAGMFAGTVVYVNAGTELAKIEQLKDILSPSLIVAFVVLGLFPLIVKKLMGIFRGGKKKAADSP